LRFVVVARLVEVWLLVATTLVAALSCEHALPGPPRTSQATSAYVEVPFAPPPGRVEFVPNQPLEGAVWIDGEWTWEPVGRRWAWKYGRWVVPPNGARYARWSLVRASDGTLFYAPGAWCDPQGREVVAPPALALAGTSEEDIAHPEGEPTGHLPEAVRSRARTPPTAAPDAGCELEGGSPPL
jgi:hypothetical protein